MKKLSRIFKYVGEFKGKLGLYFLCTVLSIFFSIFSIGMLAPFMQLIFNVGGSEDKAVMSSNAVGGYINRIILDLIHKHDKLTAVAFICVFIVIVTILKNIFLYISNLISAPIRSAVVTRLRSDLYDK